MKDGEVGQKSWGEDVVDRIRGDDQSDKDAGMSELYLGLFRGIRRYVIHQIGLTNADDKIHDIFLIVVGAIVNGDIREPDKLMAFARTVVRYQLAKDIGIAIQDRRNKPADDTVRPIPSKDPSPESLAVEKQHMEIARRLVSALGELPRDLLTRFYLQEQEEAQICREMHLTPTQYRLMKSRALTRLKQLGIGRLALRHRASP